MFWRNRKKSKDDPSPPVPNDAIDGSMTDEVSHFSSMNNSSENSDRNNSSGAEYDDDDDLLQHPDEELEDNSQQHAVNSSNSSRSNPNEALFHILERKFELYNDGDPFYINNSDVISWKELQHCFLVLIWVCTWKTSSSIISNCVEQPTKQQQQQQPQLQLPLGAPQNVAAVTKSIDELSSHHQEQQQYVLMHIPIDIIYSLWEHVISLQCPTFCIDANHNDRKNNTNNNNNTMDGTQQKWKPSTQLALEFVRDALVTLGFIQLVDSPTNKNSKQLSFNSQSQQQQLIRVNQDIHYQFGMYACQKQTYNSDFIVPHQHLWHSIVILAYQSWYFQPIQQKLDDDEGAKETAIIDNNDNEIFCNCTFWELHDANNSNALLQLDLGYTLIMLPYHLTLSNQKGCIQSCQHLLCLNMFIQTRLHLMGIVGGTIQHLQDCERLLHTLQQQQQQNGNTNTTIAAVDPSTVVQTIRTAYSKLHAQLHTAASTMEGSLILLATVGRAMHLLATSLGEIDINCDEQQLHIYQEALGLLKKSLGNDSIDVAETLHCIGFVKDKERQSEAMECYKEALRIKLIHYGREHPNVSKTVHNLGALYCEQGKYTMALTMFDETLRVRKQALGPDDEAVADTLQWMANVYRELEMYQKALEYFNEALRIKTLTVGKNHLETGNVCHNLGIVFDDLGQYKKSIKFYNEALRIRQLCLGKDNELVAETIHLMANLLLSKGDNKKSLRHYEETIRIREHLLSIQERQSQQCQQQQHYGNNNKTSITSTSYLIIEKLLECYEEALPLKKTLDGNVNSGKEVASMTYRMAELYNKYAHDVDKSIEFFQAFVALQAKIIKGQDDQQKQLSALLIASNALQCLGTLYEEKQDYQRTALYLEEALRAKRAVLGDDSEEVAETLYFTGCVYNKLFDYQRATVYLKESLRIQESNASTDTAGVLLTQHQIGVAHDALGQYDDAIMCFSAALSLHQQHQQTKLPGSSSSCDPRLISMILRDIGHTYDSKGDVKKALEYYTQSLTTIQSELGKQHEDLGDAYYNIGNAYAKMKQFELAINNFDAAFQISNIHFEPTDLSIANILHNKGLIHAELTDNLQAKQMFEQALRIYKINLQGDSIEVANTLHNLAAVCDKSEQYEDAAQLYGESLRVKRQVLGNDHLHVAQTLNNMGIVEAKRGNYEVANVSLQESLRIKRHCLGESHESVASTLHNIGKIYDSKKEHDKAMLCFHEALRLRNSILGSDSIEVSTTLHSMGEIYMKNHSLHHNDLYVAEAVTCFTDAVRIRKLKLGANHLETGNSLRALGLAYIQFNKKNEALPVLEDYIRIFRLNESGGRDMSHAIEVFHTLAKLHVSRKDDEKALRFLQEANQICEEHTDNSYAFVDSLYKIGSFFMERDDNDRSLEYFDKAITTIKNMATPINDDVLFGHILNAKGTVHQRKNESDAAISSFEDCLRIYRQNLSGAGDDIFADILSRLSYLHAAQSNDTKAWEFGNEGLPILKEKGVKIDEIASLCDLLGQLSLKRQENLQAKLLFSEAIDFRTAAYGLNHISLAGSLFQLGITLKIREINEANDEVHIAAVFARLGCAHAKVKDYNDALDCLSKALDIQVENSGLLSLDVADILSNMGGIYDACGMFEKAYDFYKDALSAYENALGSSHLRVSEVLVRVGAYHARRKEYGAAIEIYKRALTVKKQHLCSDDLTVAKTLRCMADILCLDDVGKYKAGLEFYTEVLRINKLHEEVSNVERGKILVKMGEACKCLVTRVDEALDYYLEALRLYSLDSGDDSLDCSSVLLCLGKLHASKSDCENAIKCFTKSLAIRMVKLSKEDPSIAEVLSELGKVQEIACRHDEAISSYEDSLEILRLSSTLESSKVLIGRLLVRLGELYSKKKKYKDSMTSLMEALEVLKGTLGECDIDVGKASFALGVIFLEQSDVEQSILYLKSAFGILKSALGVESIEVSNILCHLGSALVLRQDYKTAKICFAECLQIRLSKLKSNDLAIAQVSKSLGVLHFFLEEYTDALEHMKTAQNIYKKTSGKMSADVADITTSMASAYAAHGDHGKAEACFREALRLYKATMDDSYQAQVANLLNKMGIFYLDRKMLNEAIDCLKEALQTKKLLFGANDTSVAVLAEQIADILLLDGGSQYDATIKCYLEAKRIYDIGNADADADGGTVEDSSEPLKSASIASKLGDLYDKLGEKEKAVELYIESLRIYRFTIGEDHVESSAIYHKLGNIYHEVEEYDMAMDSFRRSLATRKMRLGDDHIDVAHTLRDKGSVHESREEVDEALDCYEESFRIYKLNIVAGDDTVMGLLNRAGFLAITFSVKIGKQKVNEASYGIDDFDDSHDRGAFILKASKFFNDALLIGKNNKNIDDSTCESLADTYFGLGLVHSEKEFLGAALESFEASLKIRQAKFGFFHPQVAAVWFSLGSVYFREGDFKEALKCYDEALKIRKKQLHSNSTAEEFAEIGTTLYKIGTTLKSLGQFDKSLRCLEQCLEVREAKLGPKHIDIAKTLNNLGVVASKLGNYALAAQYWHRSIQAFKTNANMEEKDRVIQSIRGNIEMAERLS